MEHLRAEDLQELRAELEKRRAELLRSDAERKRDIPLVDLEPRDPEELASEDELRVRSAQLGEHQRKAFAEIEAALLRIREGRYGICEDSGEEIPLARLRIAPSTRYCAEVQEEMEEREERAKRVEDSSGGFAY